MMLKKILNTISLVIEWIVCILLVILIALTGFQRFSNQGSFFGYRIYTVASGSMIPAYEIGDTLLVKEMPANEINVGDAVTYIGDAYGVKGKIITHSVQRIEKDEEGNYLFHTKGIANNIEDPVVSEDQVLGKVVYRFFTLSILCRITTNMSLLFIIVIAVAFLIAIEIIKLVYSKDEIVSEEEQLEVMDDINESNVENDSYTEEKKDDIIIEDKDIKE